MPTPKQSRPGGSSPRASSGRVTFRDDGPTRGSSWIISLNGEQVGKIGRRMAGGFYWYARTATIFVNTASHGPKTADECKAEARKALRQNPP